MAESYTTTDSGAPAPSVEHSLTVGPDGPILLQDHYLIEQMANFNRERIPERQPHAKGGGFAQGRVMPFATGGIVSGATLFPMRGGRTGLMGEAGPEAIMPLARGADGRLGLGEHFTASGFLARTETPGRTGRDSAYNVQGTWDDGKHMRVKSVQLTYEDVIKSIEAVYDDDQNPKRHGTPGKKSDGVSTHHLHHIFYYLVCSKLFRLAGPINASEKNLKEHE